MSARIYVFIPHVMLLDLPFYDFSSRYSPLFATARLNSQLGDASMNAESDYILIIEVYTTFVTLRRRRRQTCRPRVVCVSVCSQGSASEKPTVRYVTERPASP